MSTLKDFVAQVKTGGLAKPSNYEVLLTLPKIFAKGGKTQYNNFAELKKMLMFCENAQLPGVIYNTFQARTFGEVRDMPYEKSFDTLNLTFYVDQAMWVKSFFDAWVNSVQDPEDRTFNYYDDYTTNMEIFVLDKQSNKRYKVTVYECYPKQVAPVALDYNNKDIMRLNVNLQFKYWKSSDFSKTPTEAMYPNVPRQSTQYSFTSGGIPKSYFFDFPQLQGVLGYGSLGGIGTKYIP